MQSDHFEGDGLSPGIGPADDQHAPLFVQGQILGLHRDVFASVGQQKQRVEGLQ